MLGVMRSRAVYKAGHHAADPAAHQAVVPSLETGGTGCRRPWGGVCKAGAGPRSGSKAAMGLTCGLYRLS